MKQWHLLLFGIFLGLLAAGAILLISQPPRGVPLMIMPAPSPTSTPPPKPTRTNKLIQVQISGEIHHPGIHHVPESARLIDLIAQAGGLTPYADVKRINYAFLLYDGDYFYIPANEEAIPETARNAPGNANQAKNNLFSYPLNLNTTSQEALETLPGIGPAKAADIIAYREEIGLFITIDELMNIPGIGPATLEAISELLIIED